MRYLLATLLLPTLALADYVPKEPPTLVMQDWDKVAVNPSFDWREWQRSGKLNSYYDILYSFVDSKDEVALQFCESGVIGICSKIDMNECSKEKVCDS